MTHPSGPVACNPGNQAVKVPWRAGDGGAGELRAAFHPAVGAPTSIKEAVSRRARIGAGRDPSDDFGAQPNKRLELAPPVVVELHL